MDIAGRRIVDLSMPMFDGMPSGGPRATYQTWETHEATREWFGTYSMQGQFFLFSEHCGTHVDAFFHFDPQGTTIDEIPIQRFVLPARAVDLSGKRGGEPIRGADLEAACREQAIPPEPGSALLVHARRDPLWYDEWKKAYDMPFLVEDAARWVHERGYTLVGQDAIGFENGRIDPKRPVHNYLLKRDVILLEGLCNLDAVLGHRFLLFAVPIKLKRGTAAQCRAFAVLD
jgi:kynurenine formamidase